MFVYFTPNDDARIFLASTPINDAVEELWSSNPVNFNFPELAIDPIKAVVAKELADSLKFFYFFFMSKTSGIDC